MAASGSIKKPFESIDQCRRLLENLSTAVVLLDEQLCVLYVNPAAEQLFATSSTHLRGQPVEQFCWENDKSLEDLRSALRDLHPYTKREAQLHFPTSSQPATVDYTVTPLVDTSLIKQVLLELRPLDRLMKISREDNLFAANQATRALVRGVAHEVKNPLGGIRGAAQLLSRELSEPHLQEYTEIIINETDRLRNLVDKMLGPRKPMEFQRVNIHQVLERVRAIINAEIGMSLVLDRDYDPSLPEVWADADQLIQAVLNIVRNATQALLENPHQVKPRIVIRSRAMRQFTIGSIRHRLTCVVEIEDNGPGIDKELSETLFYPMVSGRPQGTGLGLSIAQSIVHQHRGLIECESMPGRTLFKILIPIEPPEEQH